jgi:hypothetical protein
MCCGVGPLPVGDGDNDCFDGALVHLLQEPIRAENLVVGVRCHHDGAASGGGTERLQTQEPSSPEPRALVGSGMLIIDN